MGLPYPRAARLRAGKNITGGQQTLSTRLSEAASHISAAGKASWNWEPKRSSKISLNTPKTLSGKNILKSCYLPPLYFSSRLKLSLFLLQSLCTVKMDGVWQQNSADGQPRYTLICSQKLYSWLLLSNFLFPKTSPSDILRVFPIHGFVRFSSPLWGNRLFVSSY